MDAHPILGSIHERAADDAVFIKVVGDRNKARVGCKFNCLPLL
jgi:hypothetical protein